MEILAFREELEQTSLECQIRKLMEIRRVTNIDGLSRESGRPASQIRPALEAMIVRGTVKRLRPVGYNSNDMDYFRLCPLPRAANGAAWQRGRLHNWNRWIETAKRAVRTPLLGRRQDAYS